MISRYCMECINKIRETEDLNYTIICFDLNDLRCGTMKAAAAVADQVIGDTYTDDQHADEEEPVYELTGFQIQNFYKEKIDQIADDEYLHIGQCCCEMDNVHGMKDDHTGGGSSLYDEKRPVTVL